MKFKLLFCLFFLFSYNLISQIKSENFVGRWRLVKKERSTNLITIKKDTQGYGITIHLLKKGNIRETFSAPCGNDPRFFTSAKKGIGSWSYNDNNKTLTSTIAVLDNVKVFKLISFYKDTAVLKPLVD